MSIINSNNLKSILSKFKEKIYYNLLQLSNPNLLINGDFRIWQRFPEMNFTTDNSQNTNNIYFIDRFKFATGNLQNKYTFKYNNGLQISQTETCEDSYSYFSLTQYTEISPKAGERYIVSFKIKNLDTNISRIRLGINDEFISLDNIGDRIYSYTNKNDLTDKLIITIEIGNNGVVTDNICTIEYIKLELGTITTPFIPRSYGEEILLCQRYYEIVRFYGRNYSNTNMIITGLPYKAMKRIPPTKRLLDESCVYSSTLGWEKAVEIDLSAYPNDDSCHISIKTSTEDSTMCDYNISIGCDSEFY